MRNIPSWLKPKKKQTIVIHCKIQLWPDTIEVVSQVDIIVYLVWVQQLGHFFPLFGHPQKFALNQEYS